MLLLPKDSATTVAATRQHSRKALFGLTTWTLLIVSLAGCEPKPDSASAQSHAASATHSAGSHLAHHTADNAANDANNNIDHHRAHAVIADAMSFSISQPLSAENRLLQQQRLKLIQQSIAIHLQKQQVGLATSVDALQLYELRCQLEISLADTQHQRLASIQQLLLHIQEAYQVQQSQFAVGLVDQAVLNHTEQSRLAWQMLANHYASLASETAIR
jgi:hypothetical protein